LKIAERYGFQYISVGELLRKKIHSTSSNRKWSLIAKIITNGELAPQVLSFTLLLFCKKKFMRVMSMLNLTVVFYVFSLQKETTITEIKQKLMQIPDEEGVVIDGFPRDVAQALSFEDQVRMSPCILIDPLFA
jgi:adenylate kinase